VVKVTILRRPSSLVGAAGKLPNLKAIFLGDMTYEECEISWINQSDVSPLYAAFPQLEELKIRGGNGLSLGRLVHRNPQRLTIETGGLGCDVLLQLAKADLPSLQHLELWLGDDGYGWDGSLDDIMPLLQEGRFPKLAVADLADYILP
jgi:hypothetical protein